MAAEYTFNTKPGQTIDRELEILFLNTGTFDEPDWQPVGKRVTNSTAEYEWNKETSTDILGNTYTNLTKPTITQSFEPLPLDAGDSAVVKLWKTAIVEQDYAALANMDVLRAHLYAGFGERYSASTITPNSLGGDGGGSINMPISVDFGGTRTIGAVEYVNKKVTFTPESESI